MSLLLGIYWPHDFHLTMLNIALFQSRDTKFLITWCEEDINEMVYPQNKRSLPQY